MAQYTSGEKAWARALIFGVGLLIIAVIALGVSVRNHDKFSGGFALVLGAVAILGLYAGTH